LQLCVLLIHIAASNFLHISIHGSTCLALQLTSSARFRDELETLEYASTGLVLRVESKLTTIRTEYHSTYL
jgi:hypothetical protein